MRVIVEGYSDSEAARRIVEYAGHQVTSLQYLGGKTRLDPKLSKYSKAARSEPWVVFRDSDNECPVDLRRRLTAGIPENPLFLLRIAHTMTEAWLMADRQGFADYFRVSRERIPLDPENEEHAKRTLLNLCLGSRSRRIREEVARANLSPGPLFPEHLNTFAKDHWNIEAAAESSSSLRRAILAIQAL